MKELLILVLIIATIATGAFHIWGWFLTCALVLFCILYLGGSK